MEYRRLGNSGLRVSQVGLGSNNFGGRANEQASINVINHALDMGINFIDTADSYTEGRSEELVGKAVKGNARRLLLLPSLVIPEVLVLANNPDHATIL